MQLPEDNLDVTFVSVTIDKHYLDQLSVLL